jgi:hypothetical protein
MNHSRRRIALVLVQSWLLFALACGGQSQTVLDDAGDAGVCPVSTCAANQSWNPAGCRCELRDDGGSSVADAMDACAPIPCPLGSVPGRVGGVCGCVSVDAGVDALPPIDAPKDAPQADAAPDSPTDSPVAPTDATLYDSGPYDATTLDAALDAAPYDATVDALPVDGPYFFDSSPYVDSSRFCPPYYFCGPGYQWNAYCQCVPCANACPSGQTPSAGCAACTACSNQCPPGFHYGSGCNCGPPGTDAGPNNPPIDGGPAACMLQGNTWCSAGSWCPLGTCPDNTTEYGCYCNPDGTATCSLVCPSPPPCSIPGQGTCPFGAQCVFGNCAANPSSTALVCSCNYGGSASCNTAPCNSFTEGGIVPVDGGDAGVTCLLEGNYPCPAGTFCPLGTCPDNVTPYGCTCNPDGTATCKLTCPPPPPCTIPGEGTCPGGTQCVFGACTSSTATQLVCDCGLDGYANCYTNPCGANDGGGLE